MSHFSIKPASSSTAARVGSVVTPHGTFTTPEFMPVGSQASVKTLDPVDMNRTGVQIILANAYHIYLRPGTQVIEAMGGLHRFMSWDGPILTDSGGFQVFSLARLGRINDSGVAFRSHIDGSEHFFTPELAVEIQEKLGGDIIMVLDQCHRHDLDTEGTMEAMHRTHRWALRCLDHHRRKDQSMYAIVQGGMFPELRKESAQFLASLEFPGYAIGGLSVGEPKAVTWAMLDEVIPELPTDRPRYLMGVGAPEDIVMAVAKGVDLFDSVLPTRVARHGAVFTDFGRLNLKNTAFASADQQLDESCDCHTCRTFSLAYLHHLFKCEEMLGYRLATLHNLRFMARLMQRIRDSIDQGSFDSFLNQFLESYRTSNESVRLEQKRKWLKAKASPVGTDPVL
ncbi:MAG: tRNA guanosine(34) transglycosylase Tgt [Chloroflexi bacterium]|nr:tRNA guanosine(34) transglycosylase Tgt [Chloroflexota bacterium]